MIEKIYAENYRGFERIELELSKINLFFGPNNSGKSSIISLLCLLSQTLNSSDQSVPLLLRGDLEDLGTFRDLINGHDVKKNIVVKIQSKEDTKGIIGREYIRGSIELNFHYRPIRQEIILTDVNLEYPDDDIKFHIERTKSYDNDTYFIKKEIIKGEISTPGSNIHIMDHFIPILPLSYRFYKEKREIRKIQQVFTKKIYASLKNLEYIGPFREPPHRTYMYSGESPKSVGVKGDRAIDIMTMDYLKQKSSLKKKFILENVIKYFKKADICDELKIHKLSDRHFEIVLSKDKTNSEENIADAGTGCSQVLPVLIAGYNMKQNNVLIVEEPEIHLHPKAQAELGSYFYELSRNGIQSIIETHSEHLLLRLQACVADTRYNLSPDDIRIYYVYTKNGERKVKKMDLNDEGFFKDEWPEGFFPERYIEAKKIAKKTVNA